MIRDACGQGAFTMSVAHRTFASTVGLALVVGMCGCAPLQEVEEEPMASIRVSGERIPGPAAGIVSGERSAGVNLLGSVEVPVRVYEMDAAADAPGDDLDAEPWATLVWAHGGSFVRGTLDWPEADWVARRFAEAGLRVYSVDYVLASETVKAPAPSNDVAAVLREALSRHEGPVFVGGASAGAHLAASAALGLGEDPGPSAGSDAPSGLALVYPTLHRVQRPAPELAASLAGLPEQRRFGPTRIAEMYAFYLGGSLGIGEVMGELSADRLAALPPTVIVNADADDLRASGEQFAEQLREAGVPVKLRLQPGTVHGYLNRPEESDRALEDAQATIDSIVRELRTISNS